jgi:hypothetical protein
MNLVGRSFLVLPPERQAIRFYSVLSNKSIFDTVIENRLYINGCYDQWGDSYFSPKLEPVDELPDSPTTGCDICHGPNLIQVISLPIRNTMKYCFVIIMCLIHFTAQAKDDVEKESNFEDFIRAFYQDFSQRNLTAISQKYFHPSAQFVFGQHVFAPGSAKEIESVMQSIIKSLEEDGYKRSVIKHIDSQYTGKSYVVAIIFFTRLKTDNQKLDNMYSTYSAVQISGEWKILTWLPTKPEKSNSCF